MLILLATLFVLSTGHALILEPTLRAAETMGYRVLGEVEFTRASDRVRPAQIKDTTRAFGTTCAHAPAHLVVLAWADREYPSASAKALPAASADLADRRARAVANALRPTAHGPVTYDLVTMTSRTPRAVQPGSRQISPGPTDIKTALVQEGAAPSTDLELGLFGEYAQASKVVVWADCQDAAPVQRAGLTRSIRVVDAY